MKTARDPGEQARTITTEALDYFMDRGRHHFVRLGDMTAALKRAADELKTRASDAGGVIGLRPADAFDRYLESRKGDLHGVREAETAEIAKLRRAWEEAAASGDRDRMTRAANALIRARTAERARAGPDPRPPKRL